MECGREAGFFPQVQPGLADRHHTHLSDDERNPTILHYREPL